MRPLGKMSKNVVACGIDFINRHMDMSPDKTIMPYTMTCKIWDGDFHHKILRKHFVAHGDFKLTMKKCVSTPSFLHIFSSHVIFLPIGEIKSAGLVPAINNLSTIVPVAYMVLVVL